MIAFRKPVRLRGFLGRDAEVPTPVNASTHSCVVLALLIQSVTWNNHTGLQIARDLQIPVVCTGPDFCGVSSDMKEGDHIEVEGEMRLCEEDGPVVWEREPRVMRVGGIKVCADHVRKIDHAAEGGDS